MIANTALDLKKIHWRPVSIYVAHKWNGALENHGESLVVALDITKAFDKV